MTDLEKRLLTALGITEAAAQVALGHFRNSPDIETKLDQSPVTVADKETETAIREGLARAFPREAIFGEEFGQTGAGGDMWIVDPIDGTRSFITGLPLFGMLLGYLTGQGPQLGIIRMPALDEVYAGAVGFGATCNGAPISVSACRELAKARLFINEGDKIAAQAPTVFARLVQAGELRRMGADCYPHALVARGLVDAVVDFDLQPYDYLPVSAVVEAAGGIMTDWQGGPLGMGSDGRTLTAATPELHAELIELVNA
ncbi:inositol monophosphatase [Sulfitobacter sp. M57]|uniref:inositol monophosphatase family protein n=1 Tax=unclassified Sulfitobacter TaxID=196795 RepID=UPI0023E17E4D|nr:MULTISPECIES: inositol monophosphatase family protein [unclassified Sulfitobacter]MDF3415484.1 inositol monophosphatase [Sulfitobacter sp. KE5]MDF3422965.1 inositol monophosphatase [Sulfitobacter sp. KE43]MDF3434030.1 inositol monophosphatase [Sulfitobacter sp. KE42]MDF3459937.1 inositol monophosphatase [Sulfitobacter sp. S74]MDF3463569.1 inositol monophosphatase [Sulfitobacter sp. Ks18]